MASSSTDAALWGMVGATPMIGQNDVQSEVYDVADADVTRAYAEAYSAAFAGYGE